MSVPNQILMYLLTGPRNDNRYASAMEGTSCEDGMRLLHKRIEYHFYFPLVRIWLLEAEEYYRIGYNKVISKQSLCRPDS